MQWPFHEFIHKIIVHRKKLIRYYFYIRRQLILAIPMAGKDVVKTTTAAPLGEKSIAENGASPLMPDFTEGTSE